MVTNVIYRIAPPQTHNPFGHGLITQEPSRQINGVDTHVHEIAVARIPSPMPIIVELIPLQRNHRRGATKQIVIQPIGIPGRLLNQRSPCLVTHALNPLNTPQLAGADVVGDLVSITIGTELRPGLHNTVIAGGRFHHFTPFRDRATDRFFDVNILTGFTGPNGGQRMPMGGRRNNHRINIRPIDKFPKISRGVNRTGGCIEFLLRGREMLRIHIAQRGDLHPRHLRNRPGVLAAFTAQTDHANPKTIIGANKLSPGGGTQLSDHTGAGRKRTSLKQGSSGEEGGINGGHIRKELFRQRGF